MGKKKKSSGGGGSTGRVRINPITGQTETVPGTRSGRKRNRLQFGDPLRTHDLKAPGSRKKRHEDLMKRNDKEKQ
jgi:hypothetical protein